MKKIICAMVLSLFMAVVTPGIFATSVEASELPTTQQVIEIEQPNDLLSPNEVQGTGQNGRAETFVAPIILWAAGVVGGWLATKLLDWGAAKFCKTYRNTNAATKTVCSVIA